LLALPVKVRKGKLEQKFLSTNYSQEDRIIKKISDIFKEKERTYSFEFFPPKTEDGERKLFETASVIKHLRPDFFSVTYGAGGTSRELTVAIVDRLQKRFAIPTMHHLTCLEHSRAEVKAIIEQMKERNICNILALHGDMPKGVNHWQPVPDELEYSYQLCELIGSYGNFFSIGVGGFPNRKGDSKYLKIKMDAGAEFAITQVFFDTKDYFKYVARVRKAGVTARIIPGILPISNYQTLLKLCSTVEVTIPQSIYDIFQSLDDEASYQAGVQFMVKHCNELLEGGAPGLHFFTLNEVDPTRSILNRVKR